MIFTVRINPSLEKCIAGTVHWKHTPGYTVLITAASLQKVAIGAGQQINDGDVFFHDKFFDNFEPSGISIQGLTGGNFCGAAYDETLDMGHFTAKKCDHLMTDLPHFKGFKILANRDVIDIFGYADIIFGVSGYKRSYIRSVHIVQCSKMIKMKNVGLKIIRP